MGPALRKLTLTAHVTASVGWLGAVTAFLGLAVAGVTAEDGETVRGVYVAMDVTGRYVVLPLCLASLLTGLVQSLGTTWGLFRHYWVLAKLFINVFATVVLVTYLPSLDRRTSSPSAVLHAGAALVLLLVATTLSVYKPRGLTPYGWRRPQEQG